MKSNKLNFQINFDGEINEEIIAILRDKLFNYSDFILKDIKMDNKINKKFFSNGKVFVKSFSETIDEDVIESVKQPTNNKVNNNNNTYNNIILPD